MASDPDLSYGLRLIIMSFQVCRYMRMGTGNDKNPYTIKEDREKIKGYTAVNQAFLDEFSSMMDDRI